MTLLLLMNLGFAGSGAVATSVLFRRPMTGRTGSRA